MKKYLRMIASTTALTMVAGGIVGCNSTGSGATSNPGVPAAIPVVSASPTALPTHSPTSASTATLSMSHMSRLWPCPTHSPTSAPTATPVATPVATPINTPLPSPSASVTSINLSFSVGEVTTAVLYAFQGLVDVTFPVSDVSTTIGIDEYAAFPKTLPTIPGASTVLGVVQFHTGGCCGPTTFFDAGRTINLVYTPLSGTPTAGNYYLAEYQPITDSQNGWHVGYGTSTIMNGKLYMSYTLPASYQYSDNQEIFMAFYQ